MKTVLCWAICGVLVGAAPLAIAQERESMTEQAGSAVGSTLGSSAAGAAGGPVAGAVGGVVGGKVGKTTGKVVNSILPWNWGKKKKKQQEQAENAPPEARAADEQGAVASAHAPIQPPEGVAPAAPSPVLQE